MKTITIFSWGYYGWGNATTQLLQVVDAIEQNRGFQPPIFVDVRIRRNVRAVGFNGSALEDLLGAERYVWMRSLGNTQIVHDTGKGIQIANPAAAEDLLDLALDAAKKKRCVIFFCSCQWQKWDGEICCHRYVVGDLLLAAARKRKLSVKVVEWPGDDLQQLKIELAPKEFLAVKNGILFVPVENNANLGELNGPSWGSLVTFSSGPEKLRRSAGPLVWRKNSWQLPLLHSGNIAQPFSDYAPDTKKFLADFGFAARTSLRK